MNGNGIDSLLELPDFVHFTSGRWSTWTPWRLHAVVELQLLGGYILVANLEGASEIMGYNGS